MKLAILILAGVSLASAQVNEEIRRHVIEPCSETMSPFLGISPYVMESSYRAEFIKIEYAISQALYGKSEEVRRGIYEAGAKLCEVIVEQAAPGPKPLRKNQPAARPMSGNRGLSDADLRREAEERVVDPCINTIASSKSLNPEAVKVLVADQMNEAVGELVSALRGKPQKFRDAMYEIGLNSCIGGAARSSR